ncbi:hypothetical protein PRK78_000711 [Emydomyces testavorans]|uniref:Uncharacterized protein n=1 Tax=Emydomyces testavorans TaxID=2070801 RepID=A0AAF0DD05_9EURO|nr:hypothetical protein PRK78_000711 [Emydomyces testavorans]
MSRSPRTKAAGWERGGYITPYSVTQHLVPQDATLKVSPDAANLDGSSSLGHPLNDAESRSSRRRGFWARLRRSRSEVGRVEEEVFSIPNKTTPRHAVVGAKLVWDSEQRIWLFANERGLPTDTSQPCRSECCGSSIFPSLKSRPTNSYTEEDLLFAQLPGHYALSNIYNCINHEQTLPAYDPVEHADDVGRMTSPDGQWTLIARRFV